MENKIYELLLEMQKDHKEFKEEVKTELGDLKTGLEEVKIELGEVKIELNELKVGQSEIKQEVKLLTKQTSNAVLEHHDKQLVFLKDKVFSLEEQLYNLKREFS